VNAPILIALLAFNSPTSLASRPCNSADRTAFLAERRGFVVGLSPPTFPARRGSPSDSPVVCGWRSGFRLFASDLGVKRFVLGCPATLLPRLVSESRRMLARRSAPSVASRHALGRSPQDDAVRSRAAPAFCPREGTEARAPETPFTTDTKTGRNAGSRTLGIDALPDLSARPHSFERATRTCRARCSEHMDIDVP